MGTPIVHLGLYHSHGNAQQCYVRKLAMSFVLCIWACTVAMGTPSIVICKLAMSFVCLVCAFGLVPLPWEHPLCIWACTVAMEMPSIVIHRHLLFFFFLCVFCLLCVCLFICLFVCFLAGAKDVERTALFADTAVELEVRQEVGVGVNRQTLHTLDKEYTLTVRTDRGQSAHMASIEGLHYFVCQLYGTSDQGTSGKGTTSQQRTHF